MVNISEDEIGVICGGPLNVKGREENFSSAKLQKTSFLKYLKCVYCKQRTSKNESEYVELFVSKAEWLTSQNYDYLGGGNGK